MPAAGRTEGATRRGRSRVMRWLVRRFVRLPGHRKRDVMEAVACLALARLALIFVPFRVLAARFGSVAPPNVNAGFVLSEAQRATANEVGWAVTRAARYVPFRAVCLPQAIAAKVMLSRRGIASTMHFGVARPAGAPLAAHAWLDAGPVEVTGFPVGEGYVEVARFL